MDFHNSSLTSLLSEKLGIDIVSIKKLWLNVKFVVRGVIPGKQNYNSVPLKDETTVKAKPEKTKAYTVEQKRSEHGNAYVPWDDEADRLLCRMYDEGKSISLLSDIFERTQGVIRSRLKKLGKIE